MLESLKLERALAFFDLETTGVDVETDRIVEISVLRVDPDGSFETRTRRVNPERPIPPEATAIHGIRDEDVRDESPFRELAGPLLKFLGDADLAGFNIQRFDVPLLDREFRDCGRDLGVAQRRIVDAMTVFHRKEPRDLTAAVAFFLGREHAGAHSAEADVVATAEVLQAQLERYSDLPRTVNGLDGWLRGDAVDRDGKFVWQNGEVVFAFGKKRGQRLRDVAAVERDYLQWMCHADFPAETRAIVRRALEGEFPRRD